MSMTISKILIVEDENIVAKDLQKRLTNLGYNVVAIVATGEEAIKKTAALQPDLVLMDIRLKGEMDGIEAAAEIRMRFGTAIIFLTAYADQDTLKRASLTEPFGYILKPFEERELHTTIEMAIFRKDVERRLRENEQWFATTLRSIGEAVIATDGAGAVRFMNAAAEALTGWKSVDAMGLDLSRVFKTTEQTKGKTQNPVQQILKSKVTAVLKNHAALVSKDGKEIPIDESASPIKDDLGAMIGVVLVFQDTSERKRAQEALQTSQEYAENVLNSSLDMIIAVDLNRQITEFNRAAEETFGYRAEEVIGKHVDLLYADPNEGVKVNRTLTEKGRESRVVYNRRKDGEVFPCLLSSSVLRDHRGERIGFMGVSRDISEMMKAEQSLKAAQEYARNIIDCSLDMIIATDKVGTVIEFNRAAQETFGYTAEEVLGKHVNMLFMDAEQGDHVHALTIEHGHCAEEIFNRRKNGEVFPSLLSASVLRDVNGEMIGVMGVSRDITERKRAEETLRENEERFRTMADGSPILMWMADENGKSVFCNKAMLAFKGTTLEQELGDGWVSGVHPEDVERMVGDYRRAFDARERYAHEYRMKRFDAEYRICQDVGTAWFRPDGSFGGYLGSITDITDRKLAEQRLIENEERYRNLFENANDIIYTHDLDGNFTSINAAAERITGYDRKETLTLNVRDILAPKDLDRALEMTRRKLHGEISPPYELVIVGRDGRFIDVEVNTRLIHKDGKPVGVQGIARDITERKLAQAALMESEERYRKLVELSPDPIAVHTDGVVVFVNSAAVKLFAAKSAEQLEGRPMIEFVHPDYRKVVRDRVQKMHVAGEAVPTIEEKFIRLDGKLLEAEVAAVPLFWKGKPAIQVVLRDVTERKRAEQAIRASETKYRSLFEHVLDGVYQTTPDGEILTANPALVKMLGYDSEADLIMLDVAKNLYVDPEQRRTMVERLERDGEIRNFELTLKRMDGEIVTVLENSRVVRNKQGEVLYYEGTLTDISEQKRALRALRESEAKFRAVTETTDSAIFIYQGEQFLYVNRATELITGYSRDELLKMKFWQLVHPDHKELVRERGLARQERKNVLSRYPFKIVCKDGSLRWIDFSAGTVVYEGKPAGLGSAFDITDQKKMEAAQECVYRIAQAADTAKSLNDLYREVHRNVELVMPANNFYISVYDKSSNTISFPYFVDEFDQRAQPKPLGKGLTEYVLRTGRSLLCTPEIDEQLRTNGEVELVGSPSAIWLGVPLTTDHETIGVMAVQHYSDPAAYGTAEQRVLEFVSSQVAKVIERKRASEALRLSEERYRQFFDQNLAGHYISTPEGRILDCNRAFAQIFGLSSTEAVRSVDPRAFYLDPHERDQFLERLKRERTLEAYESTIRRKNGQIVHIIENVSGTFAEDGTLMQYQGFVVDNTARKTLEEQLRESQKLESLGTLAGGIAHDFNNILTIINGYAELMEQDAGNKEKITKRAEALRSVVRRGADVVRQVMTFAKESETTFVPLDLTKAVHELVHLVAETFPETIRFESHLSEQDQFIVGDASQIHQLLLNLLLNAKDAMPQGGVISISSDIVQGAALRRTFHEARETPYIRLVVRDTGKGMSEEVRQRIFEPFFTTKDVGKGVGLGLAVAYGVVRGHNGFINAESEEGKGATFQIFLPRIEKPATMEHQLLDPLAELGGTETILLVEDEEILLDVLKVLIESSGYQALTATNGEEAVEVYRQHNDKIALVLSDMGLPKLGGWEAFQQMKQINPGVKAILASGYLDPDLRKTMIAAGAKDFIQKPYVPDQILRRIREVLDTP